MKLEESFDNYRLKCSRSATLSSTKDIPAFLGMLGVMAIGRTIRRSGFRVFSTLRDSRRTSITISVWSYENAPKALRYLPASVGSLPRPWSLVAYLPAATTFCDALRLLALPEKDYGEMHIVVLPDNSRVVFAERQPA